MRIGERGQRVGADDAGSDGMRVVVGCPNLNGPSRFAGFGEEFGGVGALGTVVASELPKPLNTGARYVPSNFWPDSAVIPMPMMLAFVSAGSWVKRLTRSDISATAPWSLASATMRRRSSSCRACSATCLSFRADWV